LHAPSAACFYPLQGQELKLLVIESDQSDQRAKRTAENLNNEVTEQFEFVGDGRTAAAALDHTSASRNEVHFQMRSGRWQADEQQRFLAALHRGLGSEAISACVGSRDKGQVVSHTQKYLLSLQKKQQKEAAGR
jgi:hypothetical protein